MAIDYTKRPQQPPAAPPAPAGGGRVTLTKGAPKVSLTKSGAVGGTARVNLNWSTGAPPPAAPQRQCGGANAPPEPRRRRR